MTTLSGSDHDLVLLSNIGHWIEGGLLIVLAALALAELRGRMRHGPARWLFPGLLITAGLLVGPVLLLHHGLDRAALIWADPQQQQHVLMGLLLLLAGGAETWGRATGRPRASVAFGAAIAVIGVLFLVHAQHGTEEAVATAVLVHRILGAVAVVAGAAWIVYAWRPERRRWGYAAVAGLAATALLPIAYREPEGAYRGHPQHVPAPAAGHDAGG